MSWQNCFFKIMSWKRQCYIYGRVLRVLGLYLHIIQYLYKNKGFLISVFVLSPMFQNAWNAVTMLTLTGLYIDLMNWRHEAISKKQKTSCSAKVNKIWKRHTFYWQCLKLNCESVLCPNWGVIVPVATNWGTTAENMFAKKIKRIWLYAIAVTLSLLKKQGTTSDSAAEQCQ